MRFSLVGVAVLVDQAVDLAAVAGGFGGQRHRVHLDVGQAGQLALEHRVGAQLAVEFEQGDVADDAGEVDRRLDARVAAADHRDALALEQRAVAVRAVGDALAAVFLLAGHVHLAPAGAGGEDDGLAAEHGAVLERDLDQRVGLAGRGQLAWRAAGS